MSHYHRLGFMLVLLVVLLSSSACMEEPALENDDWTNIWVHEANQDQKPRVLLVGDSIAQGYSSRVKKQLEDEAYLAWYFTSKAISNPDFNAHLEILLERYDFKIIHINNGIHGKQVSALNYRQGLQSTLDLIARKQPEAIIIWAMSTPLREKGNLDQIRNENRRIVERNQIARDLINQKNIPSNDLYTLTITRPELYRNDGIHFNDQGKLLLAEEVTTSIQNMLSNNDQ